MKKKKVTFVEKILFLSLVLTLILPLATAGVGVKWSKESSLVSENSKVCMSYDVYNPWPQDTYATISLSPELMEIIDYIGSDIVFLPNETSSTNAIPVEFCFKTPKVYEKDCWVGDVFFCKQDCLEEMKTYEGEVLVMETSPDQSSQSAQGSATKMSVSAPLRIRVQCEAQNRNFSALYVLVGLIALILLIINLVKNKKSKQNKKIKKKK
ncbi:MAG: hypothetical protein WC812_01295 [Candidatus Pacearchaeota archaeon]|jgi:hypothetical protein